MTLARGLAWLAACVPALAVACDVPDEGGNTPWRRAVAKVRYLPDVETWAIERKNESVHVQYVVLLDAPRHLEIARIREAVRDQRGFQRYHRSILRKRIAHFRGDREKCIVHVMKASVRSAAHRGER